MTDYQDWEKFEARFHFKPLEGRAEWSYAQMIRFWTVGIWRHPAIQQYETLMRMDTDSCFLLRQQGAINNGADAAAKEHSISLLPRMDPKLVYQSIEAPPSYNTFVHGLFDHAMNYVERENINPSYPELWEQAKKMWEEEENTPLFKTNFEVVQVSFFQRPDVIKWHESLSEMEPFGVWRNRWGDAHTRFLTIAMFGTKETVSTFMLDNDFYDHGRGKCLRRNGFVG